MIVCGSSLFVIVSGSFIRTTISADLVVCGRRCGSFMRSRVYTDLVVRDSSLCFVYEIYDFYRSRCSWFIVIRCEI